MPLHPRYWLLCLLLVSGCEGEQTTQHSLLPPLGQRLADGSIVKSRAIVQLTNSGPKIQYESADNPRVTIRDANYFNWSNHLTLSPSTTHGSDIDLGYMRLDSFQVCGLHSCGAGSSDCSMMGVRVYTTNSQGIPGLVAPHGESVKLYAGLNYNPDQEVPNDHWSAIDLAQYSDWITDIECIDGSIANNLIQDFHFMAGDFSTVAAGNYSATVVLEFYVQ